MGFFRKIGRNVEEFAQSVKESADEASAYRCVDCDEGFHTARDDCPECGGQVRAVEADETRNPAEGSAATDATEPDESVDARESTESPESSQN